jgi:hypothetical protein
VLLGRFPYGEAKEAAKKAAMEVAKEAAKKAAKASTSIATGDAMRCGRGACQGTQKHTGGASWTRQLVSERRPDAFVRKKDLLSPQKSPLQATYTRTEAVQLPCRTHRWGGAFLPLWSLLHFQ